MTHQRSPRLRWALLTLATLLGVATTVALGLWQLSRAAGKEALQAAVTAQRQLPPLDGAALLVTATPMHRRVQLRGTWLAQHTVFLDNRAMQGRTGFEVLTPLQLSGSTAVVLVQRGWVARNFADRLALPPIDTPLGEVTVSGRVTGAPSHSYEFTGSTAGEVGGAVGGVIRQNLDIRRYAFETHLPLLNAVVLQTDPASAGLLRNWPEPDAGVSRHYGYAFQWLGLASLIALLYVWFQIVRRYFPPSQST
jgi:surfeit locus 1 family protein